MNRYTQLVRSQSLPVFISFALVVSLFPSSVFAQSSFNPVQPAPTGGEALQVGVAAAVSGDVRIETQGQVGQVIESGRKIYIGDTVKTDSEGRLQILLLDETVFTIGPNSAIVIDEFVYDPETADGKISAQVIEGAFRFVTGKIGHKEPKNMQVDLPTGTIGVRGTMVTGRVQGRSSMVALLGPGPNNRVGARVGRIQVSNEVNQRMQSVMVSRPGFGTTIPGDNLPPTPPAMIPTEVLDALEQDLAPTEPAPKPAAKQRSGDNNRQSDDSAPPGEKNSDNPNGEPGPAPRGPDGRMRDGGPEGPYAGGPQEGMDGPPTRAQLIEMAERGEISEAQLEVMLTDLESWKNGDPETRAEIEAKYGDEDGGRHGDPNAPPPPNGYTRDGYDGGYEGGNYTRDGYDGGPMAGTMMDGGYDSGMPPPNFDPQGLKMDIIEMFESGAINEDQFNEMMGDLEMLMEDPGMYDYLEDKYSDDNYDYGYDEGYDDYYDSTTDYAQDAADDANQVLDGLATIDDLTTIETGKFRYTRTEYNGFVQTWKDGTYTNGNITGKFHVDIEIDFGARTIGGSGSQVYIDTVNYGTMNGNIVDNADIDAMNFNEGYDGFADFEQTNIPTDYSGEMDASIGLYNANGVPGAHMDIDVDYIDNSGDNAGYGSMHIVPRQQSN